MWSWHNQSVLGFHFRSNIYCEVYNLDWKWYWEIKTQVGWPAAALHFHAPTIQKRGTASCYLLSRHISEKRHNKCEDSLDLYFCLSWKVQMFHVIGCFYVLFYSSDSFCYVTPYRLDSTVYACNLLVANFCNLSIKYSPASSRVMWLNDE